jgi:predicted dinucleotide-binding enzyme
MTTIGFIGAGNIGSNVARVAVAAGYDVVLSNSRGPETLTDLVQELGEHARAATPQEAAEAGDLVVVTVPLHAYRSATDGSRSWTTSPPPRPSCCRHTYRTPAWSRPSTTSRLR